MDPRQAPLVVDSSELRNDIYFSPSYAGAFVDSSKGEKLYRFAFEHEQGMLLNLAVQRPVPEFAGFPERLFGVSDLESPYGYGAFFCSLTEDGIMLEALDGLRQDAREKGLVAQFIRFHPFHDAQRRFAHYFDFLHCDRKVVVMDIAESRALQRKLYSPTARNLLQRADERLIITQSRDAQAFHGLYTMTMQRLQAPEFYYFSEDYIKAILRLPEALLLEAKVDGVTAGMAIFLFSGKNAYYHLSATAPELRHLPATYALIDHAAEVARSRGCELLLLGGGRSNNPSDTLLSFKKHFSHKTADYWIGGLVFDRERYHELRRAHAAAHPKFSTSTFLCYREVPRGG